MADTSTVDMEKPDNKKKWFIAIAAGILVLGLIIWGGVDQRRQQKIAEEEAAKAVAEEAERAKNANSEDSRLMKEQEALQKKFGIPPDGYLWERDGTLLSKGDPNMTAEEVVYTYFNGLSSLDFSSVQKYSRGSYVVKTYDSYFTTKTAARESDAYSIFMKNMYRQSLLSLKVEEIANTSIFADTKQVYTVKISMLDLSKKDFWYDDKDTIYSNLSVYGSDQRDSLKADQYLYDYITDYYMNVSPRRELLVDITVQKFVDLNTGWLVSIDADVDTACSYRDGNSVVSYIKQVYSREIRDYFDSDYIVTPVESETVSSSVFVGTSDTDIIMSDSDSSDVESKVESSPVSTDTGG